MGSKRTASKREALYLSDTPSGYVVEARINGRLQKSSLVTGHSLIIPRGTAYWQSDNYKSKGITLA
ncbi:hypothetical protein [Scytonema sp. PRP1]|uniref:hypothetical protein n=1 Tax=Scytonema sp. PRP1 TaxID=3120513 RepID=UPI002FD4702A